jgi:[CysO sulfur-carrier protein]-S-L-cysteine hydrolase
MDHPTNLRLSEKAWEEIARHAQETFPEECCGIVLSGPSGDQAHRLRNIQNQLHALDPQTYPRTAVIAYAMDPVELENVINNAQTGGGRLKAFYHSHPNHDAYFSDEDKAFASPFGEPTFPGTAQIVVSIYDRTIKSIVAFAWSEEKKDFIEIPLSKP